MECGLAAALERRHAAAARDTALLRAAWPCLDAPPAHRPAPSLPPPPFAYASGGPVATAEAAMVVAAAAAAAAAAEWAAAAALLGPKRLVVLFSGGPAASRAKTSNSSGSSSSCFAEHPFLLQHASVLTRVGVLGEEVCVARQGAVLGCCPGQQRHSSLPWPPGADTPGSCLCYSLRTRHAPLRAQLGAVVRP